MAFDLPLRCWIPSRCGRTFCCQSALFLLCLFSAGFWRIVCHACNHSDILVYRNEFLIAALRPALTAVNNLWQQRNTFASLQEFLLLSTKRRSVAKCFLWHKNWNDQTKVEFSRRYTKPFIFSFSGWLNRKICTLYQLQSLLTSASRFFIGRLFSKLKCNGETVPLKTGSIHLTKNFRWNHHRMKRHGIPPLAEAGNIRRIKVFWRFGYKWLPLLYRTMICP